MGIPLVDGAEQAEEVLPDGTRVIGVGVFERAQQAVVGQQAVVFGKGDEQNPVENGLSRTDRIKWV